MRFLGEDLIWPHWRLFGMIVLELACCPYEPFNRLPSQACSTDLLRKPCSIGSPSEPRSIATLVKTFLFEIQILRLERVERLNDLNGS